MVTAEQVDAAFASQMGMLSDALGLLVAFAFSHAVQCPYGQARDVFRLDEGDREQFTRMAIIPFNSAGAAVFFLAALTATQVLRLDAVLDSEHPIARTEFFAGLTFVFIPALVLISLFGGKAKHGK